MQTTEQVIRSAMRRTTDDAIVLNASIGATLLAHLALMAVVVQMDFDALERQAKEEAAQSVRVVRQLDHEDIEEPAVAVKPPPEARAFKPPPEVDRPLPIDDLPPPVEVEAPPSLADLGPMDVQSELPEPKPEDEVVDELAPTEAAPTPLEAVKRGAVKGKKKRKGSKHSARIAAKLESKVLVRMIGTRGSQGGLLMDSISSTKESGLTGALRGGPAVDPFGGVVDGVASPDRKTIKKWHKSVEKTLQAAADTLAKSHELSGRVRLRVEPSGKVMIVGISLKAGSASNVRRVLRTLKVTAPPANTPKYQRTFTVRLVSAE